MSELSEALERQLRKIVPAKPELPPNVIVMPKVTPATGANAPSQKQIDFFKSLVAKKSLSDTQRTQMLSTLTVLDKRAISSTIQWLIGLPWMPRPAVTPQGPRNSAGCPEQSLDTGYYAVVDPLDQVLRFFYIKAPKQGRWVGYRFLSEVSGENMFSVRARGDRDRIFTEIAKDKLGALKRFGQEIGQCGHCRKQLTDAESREFGIGPVCRKALGI